MKYLLSEEDRKELLSIIKDRKERRQARVPGRSVLPEDGKSSDFYVVYVGPSGVPALSRGTETGTGTGSHLEDDVPGWADCDVYRVYETGVDTYTMDAVELSVRVFNFSTSAVAGYGWHLAARDRYGNWLLIPSVSGGSFSVARVRDDGLGTIDEVHAVSSQLVFAQRSGFEVALESGLPVVSLKGVGVESNQHNPSGIITGDKQRIGGTKCFQDLLRLESGYELRDYIDGGAYVHVEVSQLDPTGAPTGMESVGWITDFYPQLSSPTDKVRILESAGYSALYDTTIYEKKWILLDSGGTKVSLHMARYSGGTSGDAYFVFEDPAGHYLQIGLVANVPTLYPFPAVSWASITGTPTTATGYGILSINNIPIGGTIPAAGTFTTLAAASLALTTPLPPSSGGTGLSSFFGTGAPSPTDGQTGSVYFDVTDPTNPQLYYRS